jgi:Protein of unknown function (DUF3606)
MHDNKKKLSSQDRKALKQNRDVDYFRARFNLSSRDVEKAIRQAGNSREKITEYLSKIFSSK